MGCNNSRVIGGVIGAVAISSNQNQSRRNHQTIWPKDYETSEMLEVKENVEESTRLKRRRSEQSHGSDLGAIVTRNEEGIIVIKEPTPGYINRSELTQQPYLNYSDLHQRVLAKYMAVKDARGLVGLQNVGNTCFMNAALQCLSNCVPLTDYFLGHDFRKEINSTNPLGYHGIVARSYGGLIKQMWSNNKGSSIVPSNFKLSVDTVVSHFRGNDQHDVHEYLTFLMDAIHEDLNRVNHRTLNNESEPTMEKIGIDKKVKLCVPLESMEKVSVVPTPELKEEIAARDAWRGYLRCNKSIIVDLFQGQIRSSLQCSTCSHRSITFDPFMYLSVPILRREKPPSLKQCIKRYCKEEKLVGLNSWFCPKCKVHTEATKKLDLWKVPPILIIHLKRFDNGDGIQGGSKIDTLVRFPLEGLDLSKYVSSFQREAPDYDLFSVANHRGSLSNGHYTCYAKNRVTDTWNHFDDWDVVEVSEDSIVTKSAYVLMYAKMTTILSPQTEAKTELPSDASSTSPSKTPSPNRKTPPEASPAANSRSSSTRVRVQRTTGVIRRQSETKPDLWPHANIDFSNNP